MTDTQLLTAKYREMYRAMIDKDEKALNTLLDESFVLVHMTGMQQPKQAFISAVKNGTLNYYFEELCFSEAKINGDSADFVGESKVNAAVFGGGKHIWRLRLDMKFVLKNSEWLIAEALASTW